MIDLHNVVFIPRDSKAQAERFVRCTRQLGILTIRSAHLHKFSNFVEFLKFVRRFYLYKNAPKPPLQLVLFLLFFSIFADVWIYLICATEK